MIEELKRVREIMKDATENILEWGGYASSYFQEKWDLHGDIEDAKHGITILDRLIAEMEEK